MSLQPCPDADTSVVVRSGVFQPTVLLLLFLLLGTFDLSPRGCKLHLVRKQVCIFVCLHVSQFQTGQVDLATRVDSGQVRPSGGTAAADMWAVVQLPGQMQLASSAMLACARVPQVLLKERALLL